MLLGWIPFTRKLRSHWTVVVMVFAVLAYPGGDIQRLTLKANGPITGVARAARQLPD